MRSGEIVVRETTPFYTAVSKMLKYKEIHLLPAKPLYHGEGHRLRKKYHKLTYFDSLHAAVGTTEHLQLVSYDKTYAEVKQLQHNHPNKYI